MNNPTRKWLVVALSVSLVALGILLAQNRKMNSLENALRSPLKVGDNVALPEVITDLNGTKFQFRGLTLLIFFNPDCPSCVNEAPLWNYFFQNHQNRVKVFGITRAEEKLIRDFVRNTRVTYPIAQDSRGVLFENFRVRKVPTHFLIKDNSVVLLFTSESPSVQLAEIEEFFRGNQKVSSFE
jgi:thiol-disulfide isomerase/thioredoxin